MAEPGRDPGPPFGFPRADAGRIAAAVRTVERTLLPAPDSRPMARTPVIAGWPVLAVTKVGGMAAGSLSAPSSSTMSLLVPGTGDALVAGDDVTVWNYSSRAISGVKLVVLTWFAGKYIFIVGDC